MKTKIVSISKVNNIEIQSVEKDNEYYVPVRPICDALGIDVEGQRQRIERDEILSSVAFMTKATGGDKKEYEMLCLPIKYVFGWLFSIDVNRIRPEAKDVVLAYKMECYDILYDHFFGQYQNIDRQIKETAARKARIKTIKEDLEKNPPQDERIKELMELESLQNKESRLPFSQIGKRLKNEYQLIINFQETK